MSTPSTISFSILFSTNWLWFFFTLDFGRLKKCHWFGETLRTWAKDELVRQVIERSKSLNHLAPPGRSASSVPLHDEGEFDVFLNQSSWLSWLSQHWTTNNFLFINFTLLYCFRWGRTELEGFFWGRDVRWWKRSSQNWWTCRISAHFWS